MASGREIKTKIDPRAVGRNRVKRVLRDATRHLRPWMSAGDYVVVARSAARTASNSDIRQAFERLLRRLGALPMPGADGTMPPPLGVVPLSQSEPALRAGPVEPAR